MVETAFKGESEIIKISEIVKITELDQLKAKLEVVGNEPDLEIKKSKVTIRLTVSYPEYGVDRESLEVYVDLSEDYIEKFNEAFEDAKALVSKELDNMKSKLKPLQAIDDSFEIPLEDISQPIYDEVKKFFEVDDPESSGGQALVGS